MHSPHGEDGDYVQHGGAHHEDSNFVGLHCHSNCENSKDDIGASSTDYPPLERLRCGSRLSTEAAICEPVLRPVSCSMAIRWREARKDQGGFYSSKQVDRHCIVFDCFRKEVRTCFLPTFSQACFYSTAQGGGNRGHHMHRLPCQSFALAMGPVRSARLF